MPNYMLRCPGCVVMGTSILVYVTVVINGPELMLPVQSNSAQI